MQNQGGPKQASELSVRRGTNPTAEEIQAEALRRMQGVPVPSVDLRGGMIDKNGRVVRHG